MKKTVALLLCSLGLVLAVAAQTVEGPEKVDSKFVVLLTWAQDLEQKSTNWNTNCGQSPKIGCNEFRDMLTRQMQAFIDMALTYRIEGSGCDAELRMKTIAHEIRVNRWNLKYGGQQSTDEGRSEAAEIEAETAPLSKAIKDCMGREPDQKL
jgi:hypothetical protein